MLTNQLRLLYSGELEINDYITLRTPTIEEISEYGEEKYWQVLALLTSTSYDFMVQLEDMGTRYEDWTDFMMFSAVITMLPPEDSKIFFGDELDFTKFDRFVDLENEDIVLKDDKGHVIDAVIYQLIVDALREIHNIERHWKVAGNEFTRKFYIDEAREKMEEAQHKPFRSTLAPLVTAMVNCSDFKYDYESARRMNIYAFFDALKQLQVIDNYRNLMSGIYSGNVDADSISDKKQLSWLRDADE